ncbi:FAD-dependent oxidoreductase [Marispirochaeta aestuarii]|uniref:FAD-dependent oxidoreductase n=1 Tax=Marispirochaeta aestuarii TaxID=1963862 RepID=UPI0029C9718E|nr:FAD-dependent oxidoreductase [Marispirochaeta aestuarii]
MANPQKLKAQVKDIVSYGSQVYKVVLRVEKKFPLFKPGQFLHLALDSYDPTTGFWPESRVFSIARTSDDRKEVTVVYSVKGDYTKRMEKELYPESEVWLKAPYGDFIINNYLSENETAVLIAGGTGISPFIPFLVDGKSSNNIELFYGLRSSALMTFDRELDIAKQGLKLDVNLFLEYPDENEVLANYTIESGMLAIDKILQKTGDTLNKVFFISGPPQMIKCLKKDLVDVGIHAKKIIIDEWS